MIFDYDVYFFDFDGLLVDTEELHYKAYQSMLERRGYDFGISFDEYTKIALTSSDGLRRAILAKFPHLSGEWEKMYSEKKECYQDILENSRIHLMPGVAEFLKRIKEKRKVVVTNSTKEQVEAINILELQSIKWWVTREEYDKPKPAPDAYLRAKELYAKPGDTMIGFEDSKKGILSLQAAGIEPILISSKSYDLDVNQIESFIYIN